jgi:hypothetical protein
VAELAQQPKYGEPHSPVGHICCRARYLHDVRRDTFIFIAFAIALGVMPMALLVRPIFLK